MGKKRRQVAYGTPEWIARERSIVRRLADGESTQAVASEMGITIQTVFRALNWALSAAGEGPVDACMHVYGYRERRLCKIQFLANQKEWLHR